MRFCLVSSKSVPSETVELLAQACGDRSIPIEVVQAANFDFNPARKLHSGDLLYNCAVSIIAGRVEQFLYSDGVATFYSRSDGVFFVPATQSFLAEWAGVKVPRTGSLISTGLESLRKQVAGLGGFPVIIKVPGRSGGIGVMLAESMPSLRSQLDFILAQGQTPLLCSFIKDATHWRIIVLAGRRIASYKNKPIDGDFRTCASTDKSDFDVPPPLAVVDAAIRATAACRLEFAGVDILEDRQGNAWFLEANFPCYFPHAQIYGGVDIAGALVDFLAEKSTRLAR